MKLVVDLPENIYNALKTDRYPIQDIYKIALYLKAKSMPLEKVFEDIQADIKHYRAEQNSHREFHFLRMKMCDDFENIIDKHTGSQNAQKEE